MSGGIVFSQRRRRFLRRLIIICALFIIAVFLSVRFKPGLLLQLVGFRPQGDLERVS